jgi:serine/threonine protein kinase
MSVPYTQSKHCQLSQPPASLRLLLIHQQYQKIWLFGCRDEVEPDNLVLALEHLKGNMLLDRLKLGAMTESHAAAAFYQILTCILYMHHDGYLHRDLKPDNVMLAAPWSPDENAEEPPPVRLIDLGMVLKYVAEPNETGLMGSPGYMSPEAIRCAPLPTRLECTRVPSRSLGWQHLLYSQACTTQGS